MPADASTHAPSQFGVGYVITPVRRAVNRENIDAYRSASGDHNRIHHDDAFAASTRFEGVIAHGMLTLAMISEMMAGDLRFLTGCGQAACASGSAARHIPETFWKPSAR